MAEKKADLWENIEEGNLCKIYGGKAFFRISPWFEAASVLVELVEKGSKGSSIKCYIPMEKFLTIVKDLKDKTFLRKIAADKQAGNKYPSAYVIPNGKDGCKTLRIGAGQKGVLISASEKGADGKYRTLNLAISPDDLNMMVELFDIIKGDRSLPEGSFNKRVFDTYWNGVKTRSGFNRKDYEEATSPVIEPVEEDAPPEVPETDAPKENASETKEAEFDLTITSELTLKKDWYVANCVLRGTEKAYTLCFSPENVKSMADGQFARLKEIAGKEKIRFKCIAIEKDGALKFIKIPA